MINGLFFDRKNKKLYRDCYIDLFNWNIQNRAVKLGHSIYYDDFFIKSKYEIGFKKNVKNLLANVPDFYDDYFSEYSFKYKLFKSQYNLTEDGVIFVADIDRADICGPVTIRLFEEIDKNDPDFWYLYACYKKNIDVFTRNHPDPLTGKYDYEDEELIGKW